MPTRNVGEVHLVVNLAVEDITNTRSMTFVREVNVASVRLGDMPLVDLNAFLAEAIGGDIDPSQHLLIAMERALQDELHRRKSRGEVKQNDGDSKRD